MTDPIDANITGRLMLLLTRQGLLDKRCLSIYQRALSAAVRARRAPAGGDSDTGLEALIDAEIALLEHALDRRAGVRTPVMPETTVVEPADTPPDPTPDNAQEPAEPQHEDEHRAKRTARAASGYVPPVKSMEEKLKDARKPIQTLLSEDCVRVGLIDAKTAQKLIHRMSGKTSEQAEKDIVEQLRQRLQDQVKAFIRKSKGGPWADPRTQEDLRQDIHAAKNVRSVLMLARQVHKEYQTWRQEHRRTGILGLFASRRHGGH